jgi:tRNA(fMet)-specific endonuclease VapC
MRENAQMNDDRLRILDTDHVSLWQRNPEILQARLGAFPPEQQAVTIITVEEQWRGRLAQIARARTPEDFVAAYASMEQTLYFFEGVRVLSFDVIAAARYADLKKTLRHVGTQDLKIAAIALTVGGVVVTRNRADFSQVPGLSLEDWTK